MITAPLRQKKTNKKGQMPMGNVSYSAHISNGKSAITSKKALAGVAKHNLRKYKSADYSSENIRLIYGTTDLFQDVKRVYHREFDDAVKEYNSRQKREDRKIKDYFEHVAGLNQDNDLMQNNLSLSIFNGMSVDKVKNELEKIYIAGLHDKIL